ncbi:tripartite tricarboxylate transporter permease [Arsenicitalea aurantiaca]|uniref:Tripartite tricarboxylate transporter permease n=1 Tax=Arsenicitalea aurantiaca TaxID=1783274 RepID=A0A433XM86_9HYPH|nr:tripartite tricarboxylate transporter permease [Arsenicitalea aurantiaca]RUT35197.1 tripartite tricarboxylate transporter permease [Arsenicitalea aurantiaca]
METLHLLFEGILTVLQPGNLLFAFLGCLLGTMIGVLPGIGPAAGIAILIPVTSGMDATGAIIMLAAIYYGVMYGGTITSVLINTPGEAASAVTCLDGYQMAKRGRAGVALSIAAIGSFIGGTFATFGLVFLALPLTGLALAFGPPEIFALLVFGLSLVTGLASKSLVRALIAAIIGMLIAQVGIDPVLGAPRFTFGITELLDGFGIVPVVMGLFGIGELLSSVEARYRNKPTPAVRGLLPSPTDFRASAAPIARGTGLGFVLGLVPGIGTIVPTFLSYALERRLSRTPERFGQGAIEGVAGPETANNASAAASLIPLFTLGIPGSAVTALLLGAFMVKGLTPGPALFVEQPAFVWAIIASLLVGNLILLVLNLPFIPVWVSLLRVPRAIMLSAILCFCILGAYSLNNSTFDVIVMLGFGIVGYLFNKLDIPVAPLVLTLVLTPLLEAALRQSLEMSVGNFMIFVNRPIALGFIVLAIASIALSALNSVRHLRGGGSEI